MWKKHISTQQMLLPFRNTAQTYADNLSYTVFLRYIPISFSINNNTSQYQRLIMSLYSMSIFFSCYSPWWTLEIYRLPTLCISSCAIHNKMHHISCLDAFLLWKFMRLCFIIMIRSPKIMMIEGIEFFSAFVCLMNIISVSSCIPATVSEESNKAWLPPYAVIIITFCSVAMV